MCVFRWADKLDVLSAAATQDPEGFLGHPVNAFKLMKRLNTEWGELESLVLTDMSDGTKTNSQISDLCPSSPVRDADCSSVCSSSVVFSAFVSNLTIQRQHFPNDDDQIGAAKALMRLLDTYKLDTNTIATGQLPGQQKAWT